MTAEGVVRARAFAKINLELRIVGVRADGYHELRTTFQSIALHDTLAFIPARGPFRIECDDPACPTDRTNLIWRAAERVWRASGRRGTMRGLTVRLAKRIPMRAGLGGGSSDAAVTLRALSGLWGTAFGDEELHRIAADLGADVPYFLEGGTVLGLDRGDRLFPLVDIPDAWVVVAVPPFGVSTKEAFAWWDRDAPHRLSRTTTNDLERPVARRHPVVARLTRRLRRAGASRAGLSGSGSAVFGLFARRFDAERACAELAGPRRHIVLTRTLSRRACRRLAGK